MHDEKDTPLTQEDKESNIKQAIELFENLKIAYILGETKEHKAYCGHVGESLYVPDTIMEDSDKRQFNVWFGQDKHEAVVKAATSYWALRFVQGKDT